MLEKFKKLSEILEGKTSNLIDAIETADPTSTEYKELLINFDVTMSIHRNVSMSIQPPVGMPDMELKEAPEELVAEVVEEKENN